MGFGAGHGSCQSCSATLGRELLSLRCPSCGNPLTADFGPDDVPPSRAIPFKVPRDQVRTALSAWKSSRRFAPGALRDTSAVADAEPILLPYWVHSAATVTRYRGQRGDYHWVTRGRWVTDSEGRQHYESHRERETQWESVAGRVTRDFRGILVPGCTLLPEKLPAWPLAAAAPYQPTPSAEARPVRYDRPPEAATMIARREMEQAVLKDCYADIGGDVQKVSDTSTQYDAASTELVLFPAWFLTYTFRNRKWSVLVNGFTGEVTGERPYSTAKIGTVIAALLLAAAVITLLILHR